MEIQGINENNIEYEVEKIVEKQLIEEKKKGTHLVHFLTYSNLLKELLPLANHFDCYDIWKKYRKEVIIENWYKQGKQHYNQKDAVIGFEKILTHIDEGGFIYSFHYGNYRSLYQSIIEKLLELAPDKKVMLVVDHSSFIEEPESNKNFEQVKYYISEDLSIACDIMEYISRGDWVAIFLDGNSGVGKDRKPIQLNFLSSQIKIRSGIFRIMANTGKPVIPVLAEGRVDSNVFQIYDNINYDVTSQILADRCFDIFRKKMLEAPQYWRFWDRLHNEVVEWGKIENKLEVKLSEMRAYAKEGMLKIDINTGKIYRIKK